MGKGSDFSCWEVGVYRCTNPVGTCTRYQEDTRCKSRRRRISPLKDVHRSRTEWGNKYFPVTWHSTNQSLRWYFML